MVGAFTTWRLVRQVLMVMTVAALGVLVVAPAVAWTGGRGEAADAGDRATIFRLALLPEAAAGGVSTFVATVEVSRDAGDTWEAAAGEGVSFAYVTDGAGSVTAVNGGPVGSMACATDGLGRCTISVRTESPGDSVVTAAARSLSASAPVG